MDLSRNNSTQMIFKESEAASPGLRSSSKTLAGTSFQSDYNNLTNYLEKLKAN